MTHILHCLHGSMAERAVAFEHARRALVPGGTLFGATILANGVHLSSLARAVTGLSNRRGILHNWDDGPAELDAALARSFSKRQIRIHGTVALFTAHSPG